MNPSWCPVPTCLCLDNYADKICTGRMPKKKLDSGVGVWNTHNFCTNYDPVLTEEINDEDAYLTMKLLTLVRKDIEVNGLYTPGRGETYDFGGK